MVDEQLVSVFDTMRSGVYIVTSAYRRKPAGCTAVWVCRASFKPRSEKPGTRAAAGPVRDAVRNCGA